MPAIDVAVLAQVIVLCYLVVRDVRTGVGTAQKLLVDTLNETIRAQAARISTLERELAEERAHTRELAQRLQRLEKETYIANVAARRGNGHAS